MSLTRVARLGGKSGPIWQPCPLTTVSVCVYTYYTYRYIHIYRYIYVYVCVYFPLTTKYLSIYKLHVRNILNVVNGDTAFSKPLATAAVSRES